MLSQLFPNHQNLISKLSATRAKIVQAVLAHEQEFACGKPDYVGLPVNSFYKSIAVQSLRAVKEN